MFRIGEFSKIARVSDRLLRYYDEVGLFSPEYTNPQTGYRYYSAQQLPQLNRILALKELGLSLEQIAKLLDSDTSSAEIRGMLILRKAQLEQSLQAEAERLRGVEARLRDVAGMPQPDVVLKAVPVQRFLGLRETLDGITAIARRVKSIADVAGAVIAPHDFGQIAIVMHSPSYDPAALDVEIGYLLSGPGPASLQLTDKQTLIMRELPAVVNMATLAHVGRIQDTHQSYGALGAWIEQQGWQISGIGREVMVQLPKSSLDDPGVVELQFPVSKFARQVELAAPTTVGP